MDIKYCPICGSQKIRREKEVLELDYAYIEVDVYHCSNCNRTSTVGPDELGLRTYYGVNQEIGSVSGSSVVVGSHIGKIG